MKKSILYIALLYSLSGVSQSLKVSVDKNPAIIGEQVLIQFTINGKADDFQSPKFPGFRILSGPNPSTSSSYRYINGKSESTKSTTYSFYLRANELGVHTISPAKATVNGKTINSNSININIVKASKEQESRDRNLENNLFIKATTTKRNIYQGEQIMVIYKLYTRIEISNTELSKLPSLNGFWNNDLETSSRFKREIIDGIAYNVATIKKTVLTAQKTGELIIDPMEVKCSIRIQNQQNRRDPFANFFGNYNTKEEFIKSKPIIIQVKELPVPKPMDFDGLVGDMNIQTSINTNTVAANDAINYTIKLIGTGNIELAKPFDMKFPSDFEVYDPKISEKIFEGGRKRSIKTFEYVLIPRFQGLYNIPETTISTFNPITKNYRTIKSKSFEIEVTKGRIDNNNNDENINQQVVSQVNTDIKYINMSTEFTETKTIRKQLNRFYLLFFLPFTLLFIILITYYFIGKKDFESKKWKNKKANNIAQKRLKNAKKCINNADFDRFFEEIEKSLWGYFADKFEVEAALLSKETIHQYFKKSLISTEIEAQFINLISSCEYARYAPSSNKNEQMNKTLNMAKQIIIKVESAIK